MSKRSWNRASSSATRTRRAAAAAANPSTSEPPERLSPAGGVRLVGFDLSRPLSAEQKPAITAAFLAHHVVVFPGQALSREQQFAFAAHFGEVEAHGMHRPGF